MLDDAPSTVGKPDATPVALPPGVDAALFSMDVPTQAEVLFYRARVEDRVLGGVRGQIYAWQCGTGCVSLRAEESGRLRMFPHDSTNTGGPLLYPVLTAVVGSIMAILSTLSLIACVRAGGIFINQARFLASGILLILHFPLTHLLDGLIFPWYEKIGVIEGNASASYWTSVAILVAIQLIVLPTSRELYAS